MWIAERVANDVFDWFDVKSELFMNGVPQSNHMFYLCGFYTFFSSHAQQQQLVTS